MPLPPMNLASGHHELPDIVLHWDVKSAGNQKPDVTLIASVRDNLPKSIGYSQGKTATSVAIHMDAQVAISLWKQLEQTIHSKGWLLIE